MGSEVMIEITWAEFKTFLSASSASFIYAQEPGNAYSVYTSYQGLVLKVYLRDNSSDKTDFENNYQSIANKRLKETSPFGAKEIDGKKLYKRVHGVSETLTTGSNDVIFTVPYAWVKINGLEIIGGEIGDAVSLYILDSTTGTYTTIPNYQLNQFGYAVNVGKDYYKHKSEFDADLYINMQIKVTYDSISAKDVGINFILNELK
jgi:hypothetical protein